MLLFFDTVKKYVCSISKYEVFFFFFLVKKKMNDEYETIYK